MKPLKTESVFSSPWFDLVAKTMRQGEPPYYSLRLHDYAAVIAITPERRILAVRQYRPALERYTIELPSGIVDDGETPETSARRELLEETGYEAQSIEPLGPMNPDNGRLSNRIWHFLAKDVQRVRQTEPGIELLTFSIEELEGAIRAEQFDHALHIAGLMLARVHGKI